MVCLTKINKLRERKIVHLDSCDYAYLFTNFNVIFFCVDFRLLLNQTSICKFHFTLQKRIAHQFFNQSKEKKRCTNKQKENETWVNCFYLGQTFWNDANANRSWLKFIFRKAKVEIRKKCATIVHIYCIFELAYGTNVKQKPFHKCNEQM